MWRGAVVVAVLLAGCTSSHGTGGGGSADPASLLAQYDGSTDVAAYSAALDVWASLCTEDRVTSAGYVDATYRDEQKHNGPDSSRLQVMRNLARSVPRRIAPTDCSSIAAAYLVLVERKRG